MMEILEAYQNLLDAIERSKIKKGLLLKKQSVLANEELINKIKMYQATPSEQLKQEIYQNKDYQQYKQLETDLNLIILQINFKFKHFKRRT